MKTMTKRIASMALAVMMAVVMLASALPTKAFAATTGNLTITNQSAEFEGKQVKAWQMFSPRSPLTARMQATRSILSGGRLF